MNLANQLLSSTDHLVLILTISMIKILCCPLSVRPSQVLCPQLFLTTFTLKQTICNETWDGSTLCHSNALVTHYQDELCRSLELVSRGNDIKKRNVIKTRQCSNAATAPLPNCTIILSTSLEGYEKGVVFTGLI